MFRKLTALLSFLSLAAAHFSIEYPYWRGSSFEGDASQWISPCTSHTKTKNKKTKKQKNKKKAVLRTALSLPPSLPHYSSHLAQN